ncbi:hypothetical protein SynROS8604_02388 [Synechococcus sp. ROS8604]|nr:hypothetical protein SynROS8604_02388 [Synechococcus sp. ROS8604]
MKTSRICRLIKKKRAPLFEILDWSVYGIHSWNDLVIIFC